METVREQLDLARNVGLEFHQELAGDRQASAPRLGDMDTHEPVDCRDVVLPAAPHHGVALPHQEPVANVQRGTGDGLSRRPIEHPHRQAVAPVGYLQQQTAIAALVVPRGENTNICGEMHEPVAVTRGQREVRDPLVKGMVRVDSKMGRAVELYVWANVAKGSPSSERPPSVDLEGSNGHRESFV